MSTLRVVVIPEKVILKDGTSKTIYAAFGLEHFIAAQGDTVPEAMVAFERVVYSTIAANQELGQSPLQGIAPAPAEYQAFSALGGSKLPLQEYEIGDHAYALDPVVVTAKPQAA